MTPFKQLFKFSILLVCCGLLASCGNEDELTNPNGTPLPDGKYPLMLSATLEGELMTRAAGKDAWTGDEVIGARIGTGTAGSYEITNAATGALTALTPAYWQNTAPATVTAWYPAYAQTNVDISNQSAGFAQFDFLKAEMPNSTYSQPVITLPFKHQMAKVRVTIVAANAETNLTGAEVRILGVPTLNYSAGTVTSSAANAYIIPQPDGTNVYEALLVPQQMQGTKFISIKLNNGNTYYYTPTSATDASLQANQLYTYTIDVDGTILNPAQAMPTLTGTGTYVIDGTGKGQTTNPIVIDGSPTITFKNVDLKAETAVSIIGGSPILIFEETTSLESTGGGKGAISLSDGASITIDGDGTLNLARSGSTGDNWTVGATIGPAVGSNCGNINISNVTINIVGVGYAAGIGSSSNGSCGDIIITDATITITGNGGGAGIGTSYAGDTFGGDSSCGNIRILNSDINIAYGNFYAHHGAAIGCGAEIEGGNSTVQGIYITLKSGQTRDEFLSKLVTTTATGSDKVGQAFNGSIKTGTITNGVHWYDSDGNPL